MAKITTEPDNRQHSENYLIEKERQKTARSRNMYLFFGVIIIASILALYFIVGKGGKGGIDVDITKGTFKFNVDKPLVEQANTQTKTFKTPEGKTIDYTTGSISQEILNDFDNENISFSPNSFNGENLVNTKAGYIISSKKPRMWTVQYNPAGLSQPLIPVNTLAADDGSHLNVTMEPIYYNDLEDFITESVNALLNYGIIYEMPVVSYADDGRTAFLTFTNQSTNGQSYMKVIQGYSYYYIATANYNLNISGRNTIDELIWMVANFTLIK